MKKSEVVIIYGEYDDGSILLTSIKDGVPYWPITAFAGGLGVKPNENHVFLTRIPEKDIDLSPITKSKRIVNIRDTEGLLIELKHDWKDFCVKLWRKML